MESESDWVNLTNVAENIVIGVVQDGRGYFKTVEDKPVILCLGVRACSRLYHLITAPSAWIILRFRAYP